MQEPSTAPFTVQNYLQSKSYAIELMPVGVFFIECRNLFSQIGYKKLLDFTQKIKTSRNQWLSIDKYDQFNHIKITDGAFTADTEKELMQFLKWSESTKNNEFHKFCKFVGLCILEAISFTRKRMDNIYVGIIDPPVLLIKSQIRSQRDF